MQSESVVDPLFVARRLPLSGPLVLTPRRRLDDRGWLTKLFHADAFAQMGLPGGLQEVFATCSGARVVRGLHFQAPPATQAKLVTCLTGAVLDVVLDIRAGSVTYGRHCTVDLDGEHGELLYLPAGFAHGFAVVADPALMLYAVTHVWEPSCDAGVRWDSAGVDWPYADAVISERDAALPSLDRLVSPFAVDQERPAGNARRGT